MSDPNEDYRFCREYVMEWWKGRCGVAGFSMRTISYCPLEVIMLFWS
jgi:hypothetical protein